MKKILPLVLGLVLGVGAGTGFYIMRGGEAPDEPGQTAEDDPSHLDPADSSLVATAGEEGAVADTAEHGAGPDTASDPVDDASEAIAAALLAETHPAEEAPADTASAEELPVHEEVDTAEEGAADVATNPPEVEPTLTAGSADEAETPAPGGAVGEAASAEDLIGRPVDNEEAAKRVAKIFSQMQARDAARVLSLMERSEVELILKQLDNRSAAKILSGLSPEQAAVLSAVLIRGGI